jgi:ribose transport system substrate-binding protein
MGVAMGEYFAEKLNGEGKIVIIEGTSGASTSIDRIVGIHSVIDDYPGIEVLASTTAQYNRQQGMQVMEDLLTRFPVIDAALCVNDAMALGAKEAVLDARRDVMIGGIDAIPEALAAIESGEMECTVDSNGYGQAYVAVELLIKYLLEGEMPPEETKIGTGEAYAISADNLAEFKAMKESR